jgi:hypothetical protein
MFAAYHDCLGLLHIVEIDCKKEFAERFRHVNYGLNRKLGRFDVFEADTLYDAHQIGAQRYKTRL